MVLRTTSPTTFRTLVIAILPAGATSPELVYAGIYPAGSVAFNYAATTITAGTSGPDNILTLVIQRAHGWQEPFTLWIVADDSAGNTLSDQSNAWQLTSTPAPVVSYPLASGGAISIPPANYLFAACELIVRKSFPRDYIDSIQRAPNGGFEIFLAAAAVFARVSLAIARSANGLYLTTANGPSKSVGLVYLYRTDALAGDYTVNAGSRVATLDGRVFSTLDDAGFLGGGLGPVEVRVQAIAPGYEYDVPGEVVRSTGEVLEGSIVKVSQLLSTPALVDPALKVRQVYATGGGCDPELDLLGADLMLPRVPGEADAVYRQRLINAPDAVSFAAITRACAAVLTPIGVPFEVIEHGNGILGFFYDAGSSADSPQNGDHNFAYDMDPSLRAADYWKLYFGTDDMRAFFLVVIHFAGDPAPLAAQLQTLWSAITAKHAGGIGFDFVHANP